MAQSTLQCDDMEPLAILGDVQGEGRHLHTLLLTDPGQSSFRVEPEGDILHGRPSAGVPFQPLHIPDLPYPLALLQKKPNWVLYIICYFR